MKLYYMRKHVTFKWFSTAYCSEMVITVENNEPSTIYIFYIILFYIFWYVFSTSVFCTDCNCLDWTNYYQYKIKAKIYKQGHILLVSRRLQVLWGLGRFSNSPGFKRSNL